VVAMATAAEATCRKQLHYFGRWTHWCHSHK